MIGAPPARRPKRHCSLCTVSLCSCAIDLDGIQGLKRRFDGSRQFVILSRTLTGLSQEGLAVGLLADHHEYHGLHFHKHSPVRTCGMLDVLTSARSPGHSVHSLDAPSVNLLMLAFMDIVYTFGKKLSLPFHSEMLELGRPHTSCGSDHADTSPSLRI